LKHNFILSQYHYQSIKKAPARTEAFSYLATGVAGFAPAVLVVSAAVGGVGVAGVGFGSSFINFPFIAMP